MKFSEIHVPKEVKQGLIHSVQSHRISHTQLFYGQEGTQSLALAIAYAQYISCSNRTEEDSCGTCASCRQFGQLAHPDLHFFFPHPASEKDKISSANYYDEWRNLLIESKGLFTLNDWYARIGMENKQGIINKYDIELLLEKNMLKPFESEYKIFIIWMADKIQPQMAHKLLKNLEEPDGKTLFILITENYEQMLGTIISRSQMVKIRNFSREELAGIIENEQHCDRETALRRAALADHKLIQALSADCQEQSSPLFPLFQEMMRYAYLLYFPNKNFQFGELLKWIEQMDKAGREQQKQFLQYSLALIRKCMLKNIRLDEMAVSVPEEEAWMEKFMPFIHTGNITQLYTVINESIRHIESNANTKILLMDLLLTLGKYMKRKN